MPKKNKSQEGVQQDPVADDNDLNIDHTDYGFIVSSTGELKTFFCPENVEGWPPKEVIKIFKIFHITDMGEVLPKSTLLH